MIIIINTLLLKHHPKVRQPYKDLQLNKSKHNLVHHCKSNHLIQQLRIGQAKKMLKYKNY